MFSCAKFKRFFTLSCKRGFKNVFNTFIRSHTFKKRPALEISLNRQKRRKTGEQKIDVFKTSRIYAKERPFETSKK